MEITIELLKSMSAEDVRRIEIYRELLNEAEEAVKTIIATYKFNIFQDKIVIWNDGNNAEYLTHNGIWQARYINQSYDVNITVQDVFEIFKEAYEHKNISKVNLKAQSAGYFRSFVNRCKRQQSEVQEDET